MSGYTPGPLHVATCGKEGHENNRHGCASIRSADGTIVPYTMENLRLWADAPDMLDVLQELVRPFNSVAYSSWTPLMHRAYDFVEKHRRTPR